MNNSRDEVAKVVHQLRMKGMSPKEVAKELLNHFSMATLIKVFKK